MVENTTSEHNKEKRISQLVDRSTAIKQIKAQKKHRKWLFKSWVIAMYFENIYRKIGETSTKNEGG